MDLVVWTVVQAACAFVVGWGIRGHCKLEVDLDSDEPPFWVRVVRVFTG